MPQKWLQFAGWEDELATIKNSIMENHDQAGWQELFVQKETEIHQLNGLIQQLKEDILLGKGEKDAQVAEMVELQTQLKSLGVSLAAAGQESGNRNQFLQQQLYEAGKQHESEKNGWVQQLQDMYRELQEMKEENWALQEQIKHPDLTVNDGNVDENNEHGKKVQELSQKLTEVEEESVLLKDRVSEMEYLQDLVEEKRLQVDFLEKQLEQRIKNYHQLEHLHREDADQLNELRTASSYLDQQLLAIQAALQNKQYETDQLQDAINQVTEENHKYKEIIEDKTLYIEQLERKNQEWQEQHLHRLELLNNKENAIAGLNTELTAQTQKAQNLEIQLEHNNNLLTHIYIELAKSVSTGLITLEHGPASIQLNSKKDAVPQLEGDSPVEYRLSVVG